MNYTAESTNPTFHKLRTMFRLYMSQSNKILEYVPWPMEDAVCGP